MLVSEENNFLFVGSFIAEMTDNNKRRLGGVEERGEWTGEERRGMEQR